MPGRRSVLFLLAFNALTLPACLHVDARIGPKPTVPPERATDSSTRIKTDAKTPPPAPRGEFNTLPRVPGTVVPTNPDAPATTSPRASTAQKPGDTVPVNPPTVVNTGSGEPAPFLPLTHFKQPEAPLLAAVRAYTEGRPEQAIEIIRKMGGSQQDFVLTVLPILARGATADLANDPATAAALAEQLRGAAARLEPLAALKIEKVEFCSDVAGFGRFVQRPIANPYRPNERVQLYLELRNLGNQVTADGFLTRVHAAVEVRDAEDKLVAQIDDDHRRVPVVKFEKRLVTRSPLQDLHILYIFSAPPAPGVYTVTVQLSDASGRRTVRSQPAEFRVAGP
ncbi:MAG TPA: hypothetical protein VGE74_31905 [Gemmata sp.]